MARKDHMDEDAYIRSSKANYERLLESIKQAESTNQKKKKILVSACLLGIDCKYNGKNNKNDKVIELLKTHDLIPVCPEIMGGLTTPRIPAEINENEVITKDEKNVTKQYQKGAEETLKIAELYNCQTAILKEKSPSCGCGKIYDGTFTGTLIDGDGITARLLKEHGIKITGETTLDIIE